MGPTMIIIFYEMSKGQIFNIKQLTNDPAWSDDKDLTLNDGWWTVLVLG